MGKIQRFRGKNRVFQAAAAEHVLLLSSGALDPVADEAIYQATRSYLEGAFAYYQPVPLGPTYDGFERLHSELLIMLGDEAAVVRDAPFRAPQALCRI